MKLASNYMGCILLSIIFSFSGYAKAQIQNDSIGKTHNESYFENEIIKNILTHKIHEYLLTPSIEKNGISEYDIAKLWNYFDLDSCEYYFSFNEVETLNFPDTNYALWDFKFDINTKRCNKVVEKNLSSRGYSYDKHHLVAIRRKVKPGYPLILYISGNFYIHNISSFFHLNRDQPESLLNYLKLVSYKYQLKDIKSLLST